MSDFKIALKGSEISPEARAKALARVYQFLLSLPGPIDENSEPTAKDLGREKAVSPDTEASSITDGTVSIHPTDEANERGST